MITEGAEMKCSLKLMPTDDMVAITDEPESIARTIREDRGSWPTDHADGRRCGNGENIGELASQKLSA